ncbi:NAD(P)H-dependent oxidoreductase [Actinacidiphila glaucinigra]|uniref:FMN-dependent NADH-azoreductase n=1 Tax=Actinacidiphila glaucinigra TaxID=235986 RepID=UPI0029A888CE|nr:NAD(P)H-dependent oxidoreductase [Actinacidiphila glaucinigra]MDX2848972.1 NAD(P)H-dependent oxidoreductase [Streptomyces sp. PA03-3a]
MPTLLHIDSSIWPSETSASRDVANSFRKEWEAQHPGGVVIYRDLNAEPVPHLDATHYVAGAEHPLRGELADELERADALLISAPMYNFSIPSTLKAWLDQVIILGRTAGEQPTAADTPVVVVASRGGGYGPGTPREDFEFVTNYLEKVLQGCLGITNVEFIVPELTLARAVPAMSGLIEASDLSRTKAHEQAAAKAKELAARVA